MPPVAKIGNPGRALPMADTARRAIGLMALPDTPPYVVRFSFPTAGQALPSPFKPIRPETVFVAVTPSAFPGRQNAKYTLNEFYITEVKLSIFKVMNMRWIE